MSARHPFVIVGDGMPAPVDGARRFRASCKVRLGDARPSGRLRLDALARYLQDVATDDADEVEHDGPWVLRRLVVLVDDLPRYGEPVDLMTFCSGAGRSWAERRTTVEVDGRRVCEAAGLWVLLDRATGQPRRLDERFARHYGDAALRRVSARLVHADPPSDLPRQPWLLRATDLDVLGHVNNAAYWEIVEEVLARAGSHAPIRRAEIEHRRAVEPDEDVTTVAASSDGGLWVWVLVGDEVRTSALVETR